jgi:malate dehydrogenase (quinone)
VIERCFKSRVKSADWQRKLKLMVPSYGESLDENEALLHAVRERTLTTLGLEHREGKTGKAAKMQ